ncbi:hypothetical protein [Cohnella algarum]|uniref:hypothetical protein n=1 Tax=Cohnella algarum TaxID=2044859 RepID=UPI001966DDBB|nr:hypothetical protein [Cohnella algarum]MBN2984587.1 hypothetical protein [Cohnella algarum]
MLDFIQRAERKTRKSGSRVDFIQRGTGISAETDEMALLGWTKSNEDRAFREIAGFDWTKSNEALSDNTEVPSDNTKLPRVPPHRAHREVEKLEKNHK